ncbi:hypothetical protein ABPG75_008101 [Micractinium tetrahymenae]
MGAQPASILLFGDGDPAAHSLVHAHGMLARLQRSFPGVVVQGGVAPEDGLIYKPGSQSAGKAPPAGFRFCGLAICCADEQASGSGQGTAGSSGTDDMAVVADAGGTGPYACASLSVQGEQGHELVFTDVKIEPRISKTRNSLHLALGG